MEVADFEGAGRGSFKRRLAGGTGTSRVTTSTHHQGCRCNALAGRETLPTTPLHQHNTEGRITLHFTLTSRGRAEFGATPCKDLH
ncbi:hypothetical protein E2C01_052511 [Portunus trituberculatus]|uniref:Uncharacterized protein n=1 Tax=Portunus trituberculatus TaxID=210409 RepID=A0A5B7GM23_PORTR|nr:hypothetical protein [Portunus trituberculatus]